MNKNKITGFTKILFTSAVVTISVFMFGCKDSVNAPNLGTNSQSNLSTVDKQAITQIAEQDSAVASFDPNFNESQGDNFLGKINNFPEKIQAVQDLCGRVMGEVDDKHLRPRP